MKLPRLTPMHLPEWRGEKGFETVLIVEPDALVAHRSTDGALAYWSGVLDSVVFVGTDAP